MREYAKISSDFWSSDLGRSWRGKPEVQVLAIYLRSSPMSHMSGVYYCPLELVVCQTGMSLKKVRLAMQRLIQDGFCMFHKDVVFVVDMISDEVGGDLKPNDKRVAGIQKTYERMQPGPIKQAFYARYHTAFYLPAEAAAVHQPTAVSKVVNIAALAAPVAVQASVAITPSAPMQRHAGAALGAGMQQADSRGYAYDRDHETMQPIAKHLAASLVAGPLSDQRLAAIEREYAGRRW